MYNKTECICITCDNCDETFESSHDGFTIFGDEIQANDAIDSDGEWYIDKGKHYCPECHEFDDDDNLIIDATRTKHDPTIANLSQQGD